MAGSRRSLVYWVLLAVVVSAQKDNKFKICKRALSQDQLDECVKDSLQKAVPVLVKGLPEFGLLTIDPLRVDRLEVPKSNKGAVSVDISFKDLDIHGLGNAKIKSVKVDPEKYRMSAKLEFDGPIHLQGDYKVSGKVLVLPVEGAGRCNVTLTGVKGEITELTGKPVTKNGKTFATVTSLKFINTADRVYYDFENLFNGNKELGDNMNLVLNDNWKTVYEDMRGPVEKALSLAFQNIADRVLQQVPYDTFFPNT